MEDFYACVIVVLLAWNAARLFFSLRPVIPDINKPGIVRKKLLGEANWSPVSGFLRAVLSGFFVARPQQDAATLPLTYIDSA